MQESKKLRLPDWRDLCELLFHLMNRKLVAFSRLSPVILLRCTILLCTVIMLKRLAVLLLSCSDYPYFFSDSGCIYLVHAVTVRIRRRFSDAPAWGHCARRIYRPLWPPQRIDSDSCSDGAWHTVDSRDPRLCRDWIGCALYCLARTPVAGFLCGR